MAIFLLPVICSESYQSTGIMSDDNDTLPLDSFFHEIKSWPYHYRPNLYFDEKNVKNPVYVFCLFYERSVNRAV